MSQEPNNPVKPLEKSENWQSIGDLAERLKKNAGGDA